MSAIDLEAALNPLSPEEPCGPDLEYDGDFIALGTASQGKPEQQYGDTIIPAEPADWKEVMRLGKDLVMRTKDLRVACHLCRAMAVTSGIAGFSEALALVRGYVDNFWDTVHPKLDPEDDNDPTERVNTIASLADPGTMVADLLRTPLLQVPMIGPVSMHHVLIIKGEANPKADDPPIDASVIEGAFVDADNETLSAAHEASAKAYEDAVAIEARVTDLVGAANAASLEKLADALRTIRDYLANHVGAPVSEEAAVEGEADAVAAAAGGAPAQGAPRAGVGELHSREDVMRALDKICEYYDRYEPSSPLPLLIKRAKRLATKSFLDILEDLTPDGVSQARLIGGMDQYGGGE